MSESFWTDAPRDGFAQLCQTYFNATFNAEQFVVRSEYIPVNTRPHKIRAVYADVTDAARSGSYQGHQTLRSQRAMAKGRLL